MRSKLIVVAVCLLVAACTSLQVAERSKGGYWDTGPGSDIRKAKTITSTAFDLDKWKKTVLVTGGRFMQGQVSNLKFFDEILTLDDLQKAIVREGLQAKVPSVLDQVGISNAFHNYKPFLWIHITGERNGPKGHARLVVTNPDVLEDVFVAESEIDYLWTGVNDQFVWYPLFNSLVDWMRSNAKSFQ